MTAIPLVLDDGRFTLKKDEVEQKGGFNSDKEAIEWMEKQENNKEIVALKLLVWSEYLQSYREVLDFTK